jgi:hypothetical protein
MQFLFGIIVAVLLLCYNVELKKFAVDAGFRDSTIQYLKSW